MRTVRQLRRLAIAALALLAAGCSLPWQQLELPAPIPPNPAGGGPIATNNQKRGVPLSEGPAAGGEARVVQGTGEFTGSPSPKPLPVANGKDGITLYLVEASVPEAAKAILGDIFGVNYVISDRVKAKVTIQAAKPIAKEGLLEVFESVLRAENIAIVVEPSGLYKIVPFEDAVAAGAPLRTRGGGQKATPGLPSQVVPLKFVSATEMERIIKSVSPQTTILRVDPSRNMLVISGTRGEIASVLDTVSVFDVDWMKGMSFGMFPVESSDPDAIAQELDTVFANDTDGPAKGIVRFISNKRLKSILVISSRPEYIDKAERWLKRIDMVGQATEKQVHVYHVQNRPAVELAQLLRRVYAAQDQARVSTTVTPGGASTLSAPAVVPAGGTIGNPPVFSPIPQVVPGFGSNSSGSSSSTASAPTLTTNGESVPTQGTGEVPAAPAAPLPGASVSGAPPDDRTSGISVVADDTNNALVITATPAEYRRVRQILERIDISPNQVLLEATIAEVTLNDQLKFGVRWFFKKGSNSNAFSDASVTNPSTDPTIPGILDATRALVAPQFPGFSYFLNTTNIQVALNALQSITDVNVVSSPTLTVLDNKKAVLQVGNEVPVATQSAVSVIAPGAPIVNSIGYRNTGVILSITRRVSDHGRVLLDIEQEVSDVVNAGTTTASTTQSPTFQQRRVRTTVAVHDGESIVLAGLIQDRATNTRDQVPVLGSIPLLGDMFKNKDDTVARTELLIAITPRIVKDPYQVRSITAEFRDKLNFTTRPQRRAPPDVREQIDRIVR